MATANDVLNVARGEIGYSRWNDPEQGTKYGRYFRDVLKWGSYYGENGVPYCGMFVSWVFAKAGATAPGLPGAYTPSMLSAGKKAGKAVATKDAKPGDLVYFDWGGDGVTDHVGIVEANNGSYLTTIEGNTSDSNYSNGGAVLRRTRSYSSVSGVIRPDYDTSATPPTTTKPSTPSTSTPSTSTGTTIAVDGQWGNATTRKLQQVLGTPVDGYIDGQSKTDFNKCNKGGLLTSTFRFGTGGSPCIRALQKKVGTKADGYIGPDTIKALQRYLGTGVDGLVDRISPMVKALQKKLNTGKL